MLSDLGVLAPLEIYGDSEGPRCCETAGRWAPAPRGYAGPLDPGTPGPWRFASSPVRGVEKPADLFTKFVPEAQCLRCLVKLGASYVDGRAASAPTFCG